MRCVADSCLCVYFYEFLFSLNLSSTLTCIQPCASWTRWTSWSDCAVTCGGGRVTRTRKCLYGNVGGPGCGGVSTEFKTCASPVRWCWVGITQRIIIYISKLHQLSFIKIHYSCNFMSSLFVLRQLASDASREGASPQKIGETRAWRTFA